MRGPTVWIYPRCVCSWRSRGWSAKPSALSHRQHQPAGPRLLRRWLPSGSRNATSGRVRVRESSPDELQRRTPMHTDEVGSDDGAASNSYRVHHRHAGLGPGRMGDHHGPALEVLGYRNAVFGKGTWVRDRVATRRTRCSTTGTASMGHGMRRCGPMTAGSRRKTSSRRTSDLQRLGDLAGHLTTEEQWGVDTALLTVLGLS